MFYDIINKIYIRIVFFYSLQYILAEPRRLYYRLKKTFPRIYIVSWVICESLNQ